MSFQDDQDDVEVESVEDDLDMEDEARCWRGSVPEKGACPDVSLQRSLNTSMFPQMSCYSCTGGHDHAMVLPEYTFHEYLQSVRLHMELPTR